ncbi:MAG: hypothetical protein J1E85_05025 [Ruminococcus sp.]|nr:hypothetical protein [Ruminococcus sp.]
MKKKIFSIILAVALVASMMTVAMVSVSANTDANGRYVPSTTDTHKYYFYMPKNWENSFTKDTIAGIYWWDGTDAGASVDGSNEGAAQWPGVIAQYEGTYAEGSIYYINCPTDVGQIVWNNYVNGGTRELINPDDENSGYKYQLSEEQYFAAFQTCNIGSEYYDPGESDLYPDGLDEETGFDNMIFVCDVNKYSFNELSGKGQYGGEWYYYYGDGKYGVQPTLEEAVAAGEVMDTAYQPPFDMDSTPIEPSNPSDDQKTTTAPTTTAANTDSTKPTAGNPSGNASSSTNDTAKNNSTDNGTIQTGDASMAFIVLFSVVAAAGVAIFARKRIFG